MKELLLKLRRFITYAAVGCVDTALDWAAFTISHELLTLTAPRCQAIGYLVGAVSSYLLNGHITFRDGSGRRWLQFIKFATWNAFSLLVSTGFIALLTGWGLNPYWAKVGVTMEVGVMNYFGYEYLVFKDLRKHSEGSELK